MEESAETVDTALSAQPKKAQFQGDRSTSSVIPTGVGVIVVKGGKILVGNRKDNGLLCGPGGHIEMEEVPEEAAVREAREEFGINVAELIPVAIISDMPEEYCPSQVFLCTEFFGTPVAFNTEMENARFEFVSDVLKHDMFLPFELSVRELLKQLCRFNQDAKDDGRWITVNGQHIKVNEKGEVVSGNPKVLGGKKGREGRKKSEEKPKSGKKSLKKQEKESNVSSKVSAYGANEFKVKGFVNKQKLNNHWENERTHKEEYEQDGITTKEQYEARAVELIQMPCGNGILGYKTSDEKLCRYDTQKNDYTTSRPEKGVYTLFKSEEGIAYFQSMFEAEGKRRTTKMMNNTICPVCNQHYFEEYGAFEECPICGWVDDLVQRKNPNYKGGYNRISVNEAKEKFASGKKVWDK